MKWESSDFTVGAVVVVATLILLGSFLWLSPAVAGGTYPLYTEFDRIDGLNTQSNVVLRGYNVGRVGAIEPRMTPGGDLRFRVRLDIESELASGDSLLVPRGTTARLVPPPVVGTGSILLETPDNRTAFLSPGDTIPGLRNTAILEQMQGITEDVSGQVLTTMGVARTLMDSVTAAVITANRTLVETSAAIPPLVAGLERQLTATEQLTQDLQARIATLTPEAMATIDSVNYLLSDSRAMVGDLHGTLNATDPQLRRIVANLDTTTILLTHFVKEVTQRPTRLLGGVDPPQGLYPPPPGEPVRVGSEADTVPAMEVDTVPADSGGSETDPPGRP